MTATTASHALFALCPLDGRYAHQLRELNAVLSEFALMRYRTRVEIEWFICLSLQTHIPEIPPFSPQTQAKLRAFFETMSEADAKHIKAIEAQTLHDVKAVEYFLKKQCATLPQTAPYIEFLHFACTSEDINNLAYALMLKDTKTQILLPLMHTLIHTLHTLSQRYAAQPMLSRTHGQSASPTTVGKEIGNVVHRLHTQQQRFSQTPLTGKMNGAVGNYNAHCIAYPEVDWTQVSAQFVTALGLTWQAMTTQIEPHDFIASFCHDLVQFNTILIDFCRDTWGYISLGYYRQKAAPGQVGSSTMPHKINPIQFENAEGNLGIANALLQHFARTLPLSRWQRDLTDSTVLRNAGCAIAYGILAYKNILKGLAQLAIDTDRLHADLDAHWEVLGEALQTVMRRYRIEKPYEKIKALTQGQALRPADLHAFIETLALPESVKATLKTLTPHRYIGQADVLVRTQLPAMPTPPGETEKA